MKIAITTVLDDKYIPGFLITFNSMLRCTGDMDFDLVILEWGDLREENKQLIKSIYPNTIFKTVDKKSYASHEYDTTWRTWTYNCNYRFDIFTFTEYDKIIFFDCDFIFKVSMKEIADIDVDFGACPAAIRQVHQIKNEIGFEGGLLIIGKKYINEKTKKNLLKIANSKPPHDDTIKSDKWASDEPILNTHFLDKLTWLPVKYNLGIDKLTKEHFKTPHNYQFVGHNKPWYGTEPNEQFDKFIFDSWTKTNGAYLVPLLQKQLLTLYNEEVQALKEKHIYISNYTGLISALRY